MLIFFKLNSKRFPVLSRLARDYLAIQGSAVASERAFSSGGRTGTRLRNRLKPETFEALQILKDGYRTGVISAMAEADFHGKDIWNDDEMIAELQDQEN